MWASTGVSRPSFGSSCSAPPSCVPPRSLRAADRVLLGLARQAVPALELEADQAQREVGAPARPDRRLGSGEHLVGVVVGAQVARTVGEAEDPAPLRGAGFAGLLGVELLEARLGPAALEPPLGTAHDVAQRVVDQEHVVALDDHQEVAVGAVRIEVVAGERGHLAQRLGPLLGQAEAFVEQRLAEAERDGEPPVVALVVAELARVRRGQRGVADRIEPVRVALRQLGDPARQVLQQLRQVLADHVERREEPVVRARRRDPGLARALPVDQLVVRGLGVVAVQLRHAQGPGGHDRPATRGALEEATPRDAGH